MGEIDEHSVGFADSRHFNLRFVLKLVPLARFKTDDSKLLIKSDQAL